MRVRHRIPTIFNLSMVDVLCCALGCVILLWLLNLRDAKERAELAGKTGEQLKVARAQLDETTSWLMSAFQEREQLRLDLETARAQLVLLDKDVDALKSQN